MEYRLSASLQGHDQEVLALIHPNPSLIISSSRDGSVHAWKLLPSSPHSYAKTTLEQRTKPKIAIPGEDTGHNSTSPAAVESLVYIPFSSRYPEGLIAAGGEDGSIQISSPSRVLGEPAEVELNTERSSGRFYTLDISEDGCFLLGGTAQGTVRVWEVGTWKLVQDFPNLGAIVWSAIWYDNETVITATSDKVVRIFHTGVLIRAFGTRGSYLRTLCKLPPNNSLGANFAVGDFDGNITLWDLEGHQCSRLFGHTDSIYNLTALPDGRIVSGSEDHTMKIWDHWACVQSITHPALSVRSLAVCSESQDIITGTSERFIHIFSAAEERQDPQAMQEFTEKVKSYRWPKVLEEDNAAGPAGPVVPPRKVGTRHGEGKRVRQRNGKIFMFSWDQEKREWEHIGEEVGENPGQGLVEDAADNVGFITRPKKIYKGKEYDEVWNIAIGEGQPSLKFAMNHSQTAEQAADGFLLEHPELNVTSNRMDIIAFVESNTRGITLGTSATAKTPLKMSYLPIFEIESKILPKVENKILEFNTSLKQTGLEHISLNAFLKTSKREGHPWNGNLDSDDAPKAFLDSTLKQLAASPSNGSSLPDASIDAVLHMCTDWPQSMRFPALNLLGNVAAYYPSLLVKRTSLHSRTFIDVLFEADIFALKAPPNNIMMITRAIANLFNTPDGIEVVGPAFNRLHSHLGPFVSLAAANPNVGVALTTLYCNYAILLHSQQDPGRGLQILEVVTQILYGLLPKIDNGPPTVQAAIYRGTTALKAVLATDVEELRRAARGALEIIPLLRNMDGKGGPDLQVLKDEVAELLWKS